MITIIFSLTTAELFGLDSGEDAEKVGVIDVHMKSFMKRGKKRFDWEADMRFVDTIRYP